MLSGFLEEIFHYFSEESNPAKNETNSDVSCSSNMKQAIEYVVDETSSDLRFLSNYSRRLEAPIETAFSYIDKLVEEIPGVFPCQESTFNDNPGVRALFVNRLHLQDIFSQSKEVRELFDSDPAVDECFALLCMHRDERKQFGMALVGDMVKKDVMQTTVSFTDHQIVSPGLNEADTRCALKSCMFRSLIKFIHNEATAAKKETSGLETHRDILRARLRRLDDKSSDGTDQIKLETQIAEIETQLESLKFRFSTWEDYLLYIIKVLGNPGRFLFARTNDIYLDRMGVKHENDTDNSASKLSLAEIQIADQRPRVAAMVCFLREDLLPKKDFLREASIFLAN